MDKEQPPGGSHEGHEVTLTVGRIQPRFEPRVWLTLEGVDPDAVSEELGIPSDLKVPPSLVARLEESGGKLSTWQLETHGHVRTNKLGEHLDWIVERLSGKQTRFKELAATASQAELRVQGPDRKWQLDPGTIAAVRERLGVGVSFMMTVLNADVVRADDLIYRQARASDAEGLSILLGELGYPAEAAAIPDRLSSLSNYPNTLALVAVDRNDLVGLITVHVFPSLHSAEPVAWITSMVVSGAHRGAGIGSELVERAEKWAAERGAVRISLTSALHREDAHAFYEKKQRYERTGLRFSKILRVSDSPVEAKRPPLRIV